MFWFFINYEPYLASRKTVRNLMVVFQRHLTLIQQKKKEKNPTKLGEPIGEVLKIEQRTFSLAFICNFLPVLEIT